MISRFWNYLAIAVLLLLPTTAALAQFSLGQERIELVLNPQFPQAESRVTARLDDYAIAVPAVGINWYLDGELVPDATNQRELTFTAGPVGSRTVVSVVSTLSNGAQISAEQTIEPSSIDLIIEAQTRTPAFYRGRALPSIGSRVNVIAITALADIIPPENLVYTWRLNNRVLEGGMVRGRNSISFTMPQGRFATLSLEVKRPDEPPFARKIIDIPSFAPELVFYELSPLYGLITRAVSRELIMMGNTIAIRAEPYNLDLATYNAPSHLEWRVDNRIVQNPSSNPYNLPLEMRGGSGISRISFHVRNILQVLQGARGEFNLRY